MVVVLFIFYCVQLPVRGDYQLNIRVHTYSNPSHRHRDGGCCDFSFRSLFFPGCYSDCDNIFVFCLRPAGFFHRDLSCPLNKRTSGEVGGDSLSFDIGERVGSLPNPIPISVQGPWMVSIV